MSIRVNGCMRRRTDSISSSVSRTWDSDNGAANAGGDDDVTLAGENSALDESASPWVVDIHKDLGLTEKCDVVYHVESAAELGNGKVIHTHTLLLSAACRCPEHTKAEAASKRADPVRQRK